MNPTIMPLLGKSEVCERLNLSPRALEYMVSRGEFPSPVRIGKRVYWSEAAVQNWLAQTFSAQEAWTSVS